MKGAFTAALIFVNVCTMAQQNTKLDSVSESPIVKFVQQASAKHKSFGGLNKAEDNFHFVGQLNTMNKRDEIIVPGKFAYYKQPKQNEWHELLFPLLSEGLYQFMIINDKTDGDRKTPIPKE